MAARRSKGEGGARKRADGRWEARLEIKMAGGQRKRRSFFGATKEEALRKMRKAQGLIDINLPVPGERLTVEGHMRTWLIEKKKKLRDTSWQRYSDLSRLYIVPAIGKVRLARLEVDDVHRLHAWLATKEISATTSHHAHNVLKAALNDAMRWSLVHRNVAALATAPRRSTPEMKVLSAEGARDLLAASHGHPLEALMVLAVTAGMREGELQAVRWRDVDLGRRQLRVTATLVTMKDGEPVFGEPKTQHSRRIVYLSELALEALNTHRRRQEDLRVAAGPAWSEHGLVFTNELGRPLWRSRVRHAFLSILQKSGLEQLRFHDLRHSAATLLLAEGTPVKVVSELLGHSDVKTTLSIYAHVIPGMQEQAASAMDRLLHG